MTVGEWVASRAAGVPPHLLARVHDALGPALQLPVARAPAECVAAAERVVGELLGDDRTGRDSALALEKFGTLRFADPSLTFPQILASVLITSWVLYHAGEARTIYMLIYMVSFLFGVFQFRAGIA